MFCLYFLRQLLQKSPSRRLGSGPRDGTDVMAHSFFSSIDWSLIEEKAVAPPFVPKVVREIEVLYLRVLTVIEN